MIIKKQCVIQVCLSRFRLVFESVSLLFTQTVAIATLFAPERRLRTRILRLLPWSWWEMRARSLRGRKYPYCKSATAIHFSVLFRCVVPTMRLKRTENCPRRATFSLRVFLPRRLLARISHQGARWSRIDLDWWNTSLYFTPPGSPCGPNPFQTDLSQRILQWCSEGSSIWWEMRAKSDWIGFERTKCGPKGEIQEVFRIPAVMRETSQLTRHAWLRTDSSTVITNTGLHNNSAWVILLAG